VVQDVGERVELGEVEGAAVPEEGGHRLGPAGEVGQPDEGAEAGVDQVEAFAVEGGGRLVHVGDHPAGAVGQADVLGERAGGTYRGFREVQAGDPRAAPGPGQRVLAHVALQVQQPLAGHVADLADLERP